jgi:DNA-binding NtrC family response regulator/tetratricopeptide (TPR) repeat protein
MDHAKTIAMARDLLADGRAGDVVQMIAPLLEPVDAPAASTGQLLLHALQAQIEAVHHDRPEKALSQLPALANVADSCTCVRAEIALWRGWARVRRADAPRAMTRALHRLQHADELFDSIHDPRGRGWSLLGQAQAYERLGEYALLRDALSAVEGFRSDLHDRLLDRWAHELYLPALRSQGRYDDADAHRRSLQAMGEEWQDRQIQGTAQAYDAALQCDLGRPPADVIDAATAAVAGLEQADLAVQTPLVTAYRAHAGALLRLGRWDEARSVLDDATEAVSDGPATRAPLLRLRARAALRADDRATADALLDTLHDAAEHLPHGRHHAPLALLQGELCAHDHDLDAAYTWMQRAYRNACETGHRGRQVRALLKMARTAAARSDLETARTHLADARRYDDLLSVLPVAARRFAAEGAVAQTAGAPDDATDAYRHALAAATMTADRYRTASLQLALAQLEHDGRAHALASTARSTFEALGSTDEAKVAAALANEADPESENATALPHPHTVPSDAALATALARASLSVPLVATTWLQTTAGLLPDRWLGVCRLPADGEPTLLHERGQRPGGLQWPTDAPSPTPNGPVDWVRLDDTRPTLALGIEVDRTDDPDWEAAESRIRLWRPLLRLALNRARDNQAHLRSSASDASPDASSVEGLVAQSAAMQEVVRTMRTLRTSARPVLITGERGTGKRRLARVLHNTGLRAETPLQHVACETMQREPLADRLFGTVDEDGTLTPGAVHEADGGTLLIEDVDALPAAAQESLLRLLDTGEVVPTNGTAPTPVDVRVVATTNEALDEQDDSLRPALRNHLSSLSLRMPPLRERRADIPLLVHNFLDTLRPERVKASTSAAITQPAMEALLRYDWPGNVRQLRNELERVLVYIENEPVQTIDRTVLLDRIVEDAQSAAGAPADASDAILHPDRSLNDVLSQTEKTMIERVLQACEGQVTASADVLGLSRQGLYKKMKRLGIDASDFQPDPDPAPASS